jgi:hypothetical protein
MVESLVIFSIAAVGSLVRWSADVALKHFATKEARETIQIPSRGAWGCPPMGAVDPVVRVGFILACYGAIVLVLVSALPGAFALQRTGFAFALLCAGGVIGEISGAGVTAQNPPPGDAQQEAARPRKASRPLSMALALTLNVSVALLTAGQGLIPIVTLPPTPDYADKLEPVIVVARRSHDPLDEPAGSDRRGL